MCQRHSDLPLRCSETTKVIAILACWSRRLASGSRSPAGAKLVVVCRALWKESPRGWSEQLAEFGRVSVRRLGVLKPSSRNWDCLHLAHILYADGSGIARDYREFHSGWQNGLTISDLYLHRLGQHHEARRYRRGRIGNLSWWWRGTDWISGYENYGTDRTQDNRLTDAARDRSRRTPCRVLPDRKSQINEVTKATAEAGASRAQCEGIQLVRGTLKLTSTGSLDVARDDH